MKIINLEQGSNAWLKYRRSKVMATDCAIIMNKNPWRSILELWNDKMGNSPPLEENDAMRRGKELEPVARKLFIEDVEIDMIPVVVESSEYPWMAASLDGWNEDNKAVLEIKCMGEKGHKDALIDIIAPYYVYQIQHQIAVTNADIAYFMSYRPENDVPFVILEIYPDQEIIGQIIDREQLFYLNHMCQLMEPNWELEMRK